MLDDSNHEAIHKTLVFVIFLVFLLGALPIIS